MPPKKPSKKVTSSANEDKLHKAFTAFATDPKTYITENPKKGELIAKMALSMFEGYGELADLLAEFDEGEFPSYSYLIHSDSANNLIGHANNIVDILESLPSIRDAEGWNETLDEVATNIHNMMEDTLLEELIEIIDEEPIRDRLAASHSIQDMMGKYFLPHAQHSDIADAIAKAMMERPEHEFDIEGGSEQIEKGLQAGVIDILQLPKNSMELSTLGDIVRKMVTVFQVNPGMVINWENKWLKDYIAS